MSTTIAQRSPTQLPLGLKPYHIVFVVYLSTIVVGGTIYSIATGSHLGNLSIRQPRGNEFPIDTGFSTLSLNYDESSETLPPLPSTVLPPDHPPYYWANRKNAFNQFFVKKAWLWTTLAWGFLLFAVKNKAGSIPISQTAAATVDDKGHIRSADGNKKIPATITSPMAISTLRWLMATGFWLLFTSWFFGPPLTERILTATGGVCAPSDGLSGTVDNLYCRSKSTITSSSHPQFFNVEREALRPLWRGGHDISGHTFLMVFSALFLLDEVSAFLPYLCPSKDLAQKPFPRPMWAVANLFRIGRPVQTNWPAIAAVGTVLSLITLWSWMLLMTATYFHTPQEKISGLLVGLSAWLLLPKS